MRLLFLVALTLTSCKKKDDDQPAGPDSVIFDVPQTETVKLPGLTDDVEVLYNEFGVPSVFGHNQPDVARVQGYLVAKDRFFFLDLTRRLGTGTVAALVGQDGLDSDLESYQRGIVTVTDRMTAELDQAPQQAAYIDAYAAGINAYIDDVAAGKVDPPAEMELLAPIFGIEVNTSLERFERRDVVAGFSYLMFETAWEPGDIGNSRDLARFDTLFDGDPLQAERQAGMRIDVFDNVTPPVQALSAPDWSPGGSTPASASSGAQPAPRIPLEMLERVENKMHRAYSRLGKDFDKGFGSNTWAVAGSKTASGNALLSADPHLPLSIPSLMWLVGLNTRELGGGDMHVVGHQLTFLPFMASGTNGDIAWGQTNAGGTDITDWYAEKIEIDGSGAPASSLFQGQQKPLIATTDTIEVATVAALGSTGRTEQITRYQTFDGRWITDIEGRVVDGPGDAQAGETAVNLMGTWIVPEDTDGVDGITAVSFDYTGFDAQAMVRAAERTTRAKDLDDFVEITKDFVAYGLQIVAADKSGSILYTPYMAMPCRSYLPTNPDGSFVDGADPRFLLDGTQYGAFEIPADADGHVDFSQSSDPSKCLLKWADMPYSVDPDQGYLASANADPDGRTLDGNMFNDGPYIGGPWLEGWRQHEISMALEGYIARGDVTPDDMKELQANHTSPLGRMVADVLVDAIANGKAASNAGATAGSDARLAALYDADPATYDEVATRIQDWIDGGWQAESGVETFYDGAPTPGQTEDAIATMIFNAWMGRFKQLAVDDEGVPKGEHGSWGMIRVMLDSRTDPGAAASYNAATGESAYWDIKDTPEIETSDEVALLALADAIAFLESAPTGDGEGGFGTDDMTQWIWGMRHLVDMEPLLLELFGQDLAFLVSDFAINPDTFPVAEGLSPADERDHLPGFPRHGDHHNIDAGNSGDNGVSFDNSYGPTARMVVELTPEGATGFNIVPGGQSADPESEHFSDQARLWLGNDYMQISTIPSEIAGFSTSRVTFTK